MNNSNTVIKVEKERIERRSGEEGMEKGVWKGNGKEK